jgi:large repetitive protein
MASAPCKPMSRAPGLCVLVGLASLAAGCGDEPTRGPPDGAVDASAAAPIDPVDPADLLARAKDLVRPGSVMQMEPRLGVPTFLWARSSSASLSRPQWLVSGIPDQEVAAARATLADYAPLYGLADGDADDAVVAHVHDRGDGPILVKFRAEVAGIEIFREELNVVLDRNLDAVALSGYITSPATPPARPGGLDFQLAAPAAAALAIDQLAGTGVDASHVVPTGSRDGYDTFDLTAAAGVELDEPVRVKPVYFHAPGGLEAAYYVEVLARTGLPPPGILGADGSPLRLAEGHAYVISAATGQVLFRNDLTDDAAPTAPGEQSAIGTGGFTYRVWADPVTGIPYDTPAGNDVHPKVVPSPDGAQPDFVATSDVTLPNFPFSREDPWLPSGATQTLGNNVDAYLNLFSPDGIGNPTTTTPTDPPNGDFRAQITSPGQFLHEQIPDGNGGLAEGRHGSIQQLFYDINFLHDWFYDAGFDEAAGNAQTDNFGRGGLGNDSMKAQVQDLAGFNNANMLTPADGTRPRMRMYAFRSLASMLHVQAPASIAGVKSIGISMSGPQTYDVTTDIVRATFANPGCAVSNAAALAGKIAMFDFDNTDGTGCSFSTRITRLTAQTTASAILMVYTSASPTLIASITGFVAANTRAVATISWNTGQAIKGQLAVPATVTARLFRGADRDGALDNQIVFHEYFHFVSNRLVGNGSGLATNLASGLGEGWSDFSSMLLTVRENDTATPSNATFNGAYALATYATSGEPADGSANHGYYYGIRRYPYSTDMAINPLTFKHIANGQALPVGPPVAFGADGASNSQVHNTGEVWANMLWECYAGLLRDTLGSTPRLTFQQAQDRMKQYLIAALKVTPQSPTLTEARDALLAVALASDTSDYVAFRLAFARRGAGVHAVSPDRLSSTNVGVVEDFTSGPELAIESVTIDDTLGTCDADGVVDHGEYGRLTVTLRNIGTTALSATSATISSPGADVWFPLGTSLSFPAMALNATATASLRFAYLGSVTGIQQLDFQIDYTDSQMSAPLSDTVGFRTNVDEVAASTATDTVEPTATPTTTGFNATFGDVAPWRRVEVDPLAHIWHVDDPHAGSDQYLISPVMTVDGSGSVGLQLDHSWGFEFDGGGNYDGGVIEMSVNGGAFTDIGSSAYNGTILSYSGNVNPLGGRPGFVANSAGTVHTSLTRAVAPGSTVRIRFRAASDSSIGAAGWTIDNIAYAGVIETSFATVVEDTGACAMVPTSTDLAITVSDGVTSANVGGSVTYTIAATNAGTQDIVGATVADAFPGDLTCAWTCAGSAGGACTASGSGNILDLAVLPAGGTATYTASCTVSASTASTSLSNTATIGPPGPVTDPVPGNNAATDVDTLIRVPAHLTGSKIVSGDLVEGGTAIYTIVLTNDGAGRQFDNAGHELEDVLPAGLTLISANATAGTTVANAGTSTVTWNGSIEAGASVTITIVAAITASAGTMISNQASFAYDSDGDAINEATGVTDAYPCP